jgi:ribosomal protein S26
MTCPHGEPDPSCCIDCLEGPPAPKSIARTRLPSEREQAAIYRTSCATDQAHYIDVGDIIRLTADGWSCVECAAPPRSLT